MFVYIEFIFLLKYILIYLHITHKIHNLFYGQICFPQNGNIVLTKVIKNIYMYVHKY